MVRSVVEEGLSKTAAACRFNTTIEFENLAQYGSCVQSGIEGADERSRKTARCASIKNTSVVNEASCDPRAVSPDTLQTEETLMKAAKYTPSDLNNGFVVAIEIVAKAGEEDAVARGLEILSRP